jgi:hypothetical protein
MGSSSSLNLDHWVKRTYISSYFDIEFLNEKYNKMNQKIRNYGRNAILKWIMMGENDEIFAVKYYAIDKIPGKIRKQILKIVIGIIYNYGAEGGNVEIISKDEMKDIVEVSDNIEKDLQYYCNAIFPKLEEDEKAFMEWIENTRFSQQEKK